MDRRSFLRYTSAALAAGEAHASGQVPLQADRTAVFYDSASLGHRPSAGHPERPARLETVMAAVRALERNGRVRTETPRSATDVELARVHDTDYIALVAREVGAQRRTLSTGDTEISPGTLDAARAAAGSVISAVDALMAGRTRRAFCAVRPPGHHASQRRGMGFCVFNNIAVGARHAQAKYGVQRVLVADWDVHHGNGTQTVFWEDGSVLFFDTHQHPWYPGTGTSDETGEGKGRGLIINRPLPAGSGRADVLGAFRDVLVPAAERFKPELVMVSAGFDSRRDDPLGQFTLTDADFADLTDIVCQIATRHAAGRLVSVLEGGYSLEGLQSAVTAHLERLSAP